MLAGSSRLIFVSEVVDFPCCGSFVSVLTSTLSSGEYQRVVVICIGAVLPNWPAGIVRILWVPCANMPFTVFEPRSWLVTLVFEPARKLGREVPVLAGGNVNLCAVFFAGSRT